jgi:hypothetical protein
MDYWCERYFSQPNYWRIGGKPWCSIFQLSSLMENLGGAKGVAKGMERLRKRAQKNGEGEIMLGLFTWSPADAKLAREIGFDHVTSYNVASKQNQQAGEALIDYRDVMANHEKTWRAIAETGVDYWPVVTQGWDVSARNHPYEPWPPVRYAWPWGHIVTGNTPQRFGELVTRARQFMATQSGQKEKVMVINAWNEWTEGSVLLPTKENGWGVLKALKGALGKR